MHRGGEAVQIFHRSTNALARFTIFGGFFVVAFVAWIAASLARSPYVTHAGIVRVQPVQFSHEHHVSGLGIDCRYCHTTVETQAFAGIPPTKTCMNCHARVWPDAPELEPVRKSFRTGESIAWTRVHELPGYVYFDHSVHVKKGVGCATCHGRVDKMQAVFAAATLQMEWCVECHRAPERFVRPREAVFDMAWEPGPEGQLALGRTTVEKYHIGKPESLTSCSTCHR